MRTVAILAVLLGLLSLGGAADLPLVQDGKSAYSIYVQPEAPATVKAAAADLQSYLEKVTGARLPVVQSPQEPMISLGDNPALRAAGVTVEQVPLEGYRIVARGANLYIAGPDTADGAVTPQGGTSAGTRNGVYTFIERFLGVRFLMPGEHGDYIPRVPTVAIPDNTDISDAPFFLNRRVPYTQERTEASKRWWARQKLGHSLLLLHSHNWRAIPPEAFAQHPEWFAESGGSRVPPSGEYKLCVTNEGLIRAFADAAIKYFDENPQSTSYSLSPSDGGGWCQCARCTAMYEKDPNGALSVTPAIIAFYNAVAELVAERYPQKLLAGYIYANYVYPPSKPFKLAPNMFLVWAPSFDYGFTLFRPEMQRRWDELVPQWLQVTDKISYYDLPNCVHNEIGAMNPPGLKILKFLYPRLKQANMKGVYVYGTPAWGHAGPMNYLLAKLAWDPEADVDAIFNEYLDKCYAEGAPEIKQFYLLLDEATERYYNEVQTETYVLTERRMKEVYAANFAELERLYRAAESKVTDPDARARLAMLGDNMTVLHWNLRQFKLLDDPEGSSFYLSDPDFFAFMKKNAGSLALAPTTATQVAGMDEAMAVTPARASAGSPVTPFLLRGAQRLIIRPTGEQPAQVAFSSITSRGGLVKYQLYGSRGELCDQGVVSAEVPVKLPNDGSDYYQLLLSRGSHTLSLKVTGAAWAVYGESDDKGLHLLSKTTPLYFSVPAGTASFSLWVAAEPPGETAAARLYAPDGREVAAFACTEKSVDLQTITVGANDGGIWKLVLEDAPIGITDDVWVKLGSEVPAWFSLDPDSVLVVEKGK